MCGSALWSFAFHARLFAGFFPEPRVASHICPWETRSVPEFGQVAVVRGLGGGGLDAPLASFPSRTVFVSSRLLSPATLALVTGHRLLPRPSHGATVPR